MKSTVLIATAFMVLFSGFGSCTHTTSVGPVALGIAGSWQWVASTGGIAGITRTPASEGYTRRIEFPPDGIFKEYRNDTLTRATRYTILREQSPFHSGLSDVVHYADPGMAQPQEVTFAGTDTLRLADVCIDCFMHTYSRIP